VTRLQRLKTPSEFRRVLANGKRLATVGAIIAIAPGNPEEPARIGIVATRRIGSAVARNRAKRLLREAARRATFPRGIDAVLIARPAVMRAPFQRLADEIAQAVGAAGREAASC